MNSHFQSSATTSTRSGLLFEGIGARGSSWWELIQITPPNRITISVGIDQRTNSVRPSYPSSVLRPACALDARYHQANPKVARITGITTTSIIAVELSRSSSCADAIGPCGSRMPCWLQEATAVAAHRTRYRSKPGLRGPCPTLDVG